MAQEQILDRVLNILNVGGGEISVITQLIQNQIDAVNLYCGTTTLPTELEYVVVETTIARYNRLGSEGYSQEQIDALGTSYAQDLLAPYKPSMDRYIRRKHPKKVRFI